MIPPGNTNRLNRDFILIKKNIFDQEFKLLWIFEFGQQNPPKVIRQTNMSPLNELFLSNYGSFSGDYFFF